MRALQQVLENGSKVTYILESDQGSGSAAGDAFTEVYSGTLRQHKLTKLQPATCYTFRLAAINAIGKRFVWRIIHVLLGGIGHVL